MFVLPRQGGYKVKCNSDSSSRKPCSVLLFFGPAHTDSFWSVCGSKRARESSWAGTVIMPYTPVIFHPCDDNLHYCLTKISIRAKRSISRVFSLFIVPSPFFVHCPYKGRINRAESVLTGLKPY